MLAKAEEVNSINSDNEEVKDATFEIFQKYTNFHVNKPLGPVEDNKLPFEIERTHRGNLPVYSEYKHGGQQKKTVIRNIFGDIEEFKEELSKVVSNSPIIEKMGRLEVSGIHTSKVKLWLTRLGY